MKRILDFLLSLFLLVMLAPAMMAICTAIILSSGFPILFRHRRIGLNGQPFELLKFRSMVPNASSLGGYSTADDDPRITPIGSFLRKTSVDELPQLINVLRGEMSLVGPRPDVPAQAANYAPDDWAQRCSVRPGITGLAQSRLRSNATPTQRLTLDLEYVRNQSMIGDLTILFSTLLTLFRNRVN